ncbi:MAG: hypothetical protein WAK75_05395 [Methanoregula sp.]|uniref:hypothetical protein n=1 Tax=Methanoregula sp. TaxID=2052170 RepID=UPI003BAF53E6
MAVPKNSVRCITRNEPKESIYTSKRRESQVVIVVTETDLQRKHTKISEIREVVGVFECDIEDMKYSPLKIKVQQILNAGGESYIGVANLMVKGKGCADYYRSMRPRNTKEEALEDAADGFFAFLSDESEIKEVENW